MLNTERLMASELWALATGDEFKAAMGLWCRAWKQVPAGSLPNDERVLAAFSGAGKGWVKVRDVALRGFVECSDGRIYHKTLCDDVRRAAAAKRERQERTKAATEARKAQRSGQRDVNVTTSHRRDGKVIEEGSTPLSPPGGGAGVSEKGFKNGRRGQSYSIRDSVAQAFEYIEDRDQGRSEEGSADDLELLS